MDTDMSTTRETLTDIAYRLDAQKSKQDPCFAEVEGWRGKKPIRAVPSTEKLREALKEACETNNIALLIKAGLIAPKVRVTSLHDYLDVPSLMSYLDTLEAGHGILKSDILLRMQDEQKIVDGPVSARHEQCMLMLGRESEPGAGDGPQVPLKHGMLAHTYKIGWYEYACVNGLAPEASDHVVKCVSDAAQKVFRGAVRIKDDRNKGALPVGYWDGEEVIAPLRALSGKLFVEGIARNRSIFRGALLHVTQGLVNLGEKSRGDARLTYYKESGEKKEVRFAEEKTWSGARKKREVDINGCLRFLEADKDPELLRAIEINPKAVTRHICQLIQGRSKGHLKVTGTIDRELLQASALEENASPDQGVERGPVKAHEAHEQPRGNAIDVDAIDRRRARARAGRSGDGRGRSRDNSPYPDGG